VSPRQSHFCLTPSPCTRLSRAPSTVWVSPTSTSASASLWMVRSVRVLGETRVPSRRWWISQVPRCFRFRACCALRPRRSLQSPSPVAGTYYCLPGFRPCRPADDKVTRLNRFTCVTARSSLCLRLTHLVTSMSPRLDSRWGGSFPFPRRESHPLKASGFVLTHRRTHTQIFRASSATSRNRRSETEHPRSRRRVGISKYRCLVAQKSAALQVLGEAIFSNTLQAI
jgi:hypothetical protein